MIKKSECVIPSSEHNYGQQDTGDHGKEPMGLEAYWFPSRQPHKTGWLYSEILAYPHCSAKGVWRIHAGSSKKGLHILLIMS